MIIKEGKAARGYFCEVKRIEHHRTRQMLLERGTHTIITAYLKTVSKLAVTAAVCPMTASSIKK